MTTFKKSYLFSCFLILIGILFIPLLSQSVAAEPGDEVELTGTFNVVWGDSEDGKSAMEYSITDELGVRTILELETIMLKDLGGALSLIGKPVTLRGIIIPPIIIDLPTVQSTQPIQPQQIGPTRIDVKEISIPMPPQSLSPQLMSMPVIASVSGSHPWVTIMCKFDDISDEPEDRDYFVGMYGDEQPGLNHYWKEISFNQVNIAGSTAAPDWYDLPEDEIYYNPTDTEKGTDRDKLAKDCLDAADPHVDFSLYDGINMMFNSNFDNGWAWGGTRHMTRDGTTKTWSITWEPPWAYRTISVIAHEMGHGFGLPHSSFDRSAVYDSWWDVMSWDRYNCGASTDPDYGCMAQHTISFHKDMLGWIPIVRKIEVGADSHATIILEDLAAPALGNYHMLTVPIGGSATNFYTVEARRFTGYDIKLPEEAVVIHNVDTTEDIPAVLIPDGGNVSDAWTVGEEFVDGDNDIIVMVKSDTSTGFEVTVSNGNYPPVSDANGIYSEECAGSTTSLMLDGTGSYDPEGDDLTYSWSTNCVGSFDNATLAQPTLFVNTADVCDHSCSVSLVVADESGLEGFSDSAIVTIVDTIPPSLSGVPVDVTVECDTVPDPPTVTATDICDTDVSVDPLNETRTDGSCIDNYTLTREWTVSDDCGNGASAQQVLTVQDTTGPIISCDSPATITPPDAPISFTASATDNCAEEVIVELTGYDCFKYTKKGKIVDKKESCIVQLVDDTVTILDSGGVDTYITWDAQSSDNCGNVTQSTCSVQVVNPAQP